MVKDKPILGYGFDGFRKNYMNYQAAYLQEKQLPETINNLADDNHHAFNEFLRIIIEQGIIGVIILFIFLTTIGYTIYKYKLYIDTVSRTIISCLTALLFFSFFFLSAFDISYKCLNSDITGRISLFFSRYSNMEVTNKIY